MGLLDQLNDVLLQTPRKYWGDKATRLGSLLSDSASTGAQAYGSANSPMAPEHSQTLAGLLADFTPGVGDVKSAYDGMNAAREGDYLGAALGGLGALPLVPNLAGMFIGKGAKTWDAVNASRAMEMEQAGIDPRKIWSETGNWKGPDGHWRQEIPDTNAVPGHRFYSWGENADLQQGNGTVVRRQKALLHPALSAAYPETKNIAVSLRPGSKNGSFNEESKWMTVGADPKNFAADKSTTLHELQHAIQQREGFARGGAPEEFASGPMFDRRAQDLQFDLSKTLTGGTFAGPKELADSIRFGEPSQLADIADKYGFKNIKEAIRFLEAEDVKRTPFGQYQRLAGEAEARATQARMNMDAAQRRKAFPEDSYDVPLGSLIIRK